MSQLTELDPVLVTPLRRPKPQSTQQSASAAQERSPMFKVAIAIVAGTLVLACAGRIIQFATEPLLSMHQAGREIKELRRERARRTADNNRLRADIVYLNSNAGIEQEARRRGWVKPGEVALSIVVPDAPPEVKVAAAKPAVHTRTASADHSRSIADRIRAAVDNCLAAFGGGGTETR